jgi:hypothetical protein
MNTSRLLGLAVAAALLAAPVAACGDETDRSDDADATSTGSPTATRTGAPLPGTPLSGTPDPARFVTSIDNEWLPYRPGARWVFDSTGDEDTRIVTTVTDRTRVVQGVTCVVVHDVESTPEGEVLEDTYDWYAQDVDGNVWYFGEDTTAYEDGKSTKEGSWEAGVDGAQAGIVMPADPQVGDAYQQEYWEGEAEDHGEVIDASGSHSSVPATYGDLVVTKDTTPLEPDLVEHKYYAAGVGVVREETVEGGSEEVRLVSVSMPG